MIDTQNKPLKMFAIEAKGYGAINKPTKIAHGLKVRVEKKFFYIQDKKFKLEYIASLTQTFNETCKYLEAAGRLTNLFGEPILLKEYD